MKQALRFLYNKYFIAIAVFLVIMLVFDQNDWFTQWNRKKQLEEANKNIDFLKKEVAAMSEELYNLEHDPEIIKKYAREKYYYKQKDEDIFLIINDTVYKNKNK